MAETRFSVERVRGNPLIVPEMSASIGTNINGPSLIRVPDWVENPLGRYYLYFAHHKGKFIRLAFADNVEGPYEIYEPGSLHLEDSGFPTTIRKEDMSPGVANGLKAQGLDPNEFLYPHIASPEVVIVAESQQIWLYYHGMLADGTQMSRVAVSSDGLSLKSLPDIISHPYLRMFRYRDAWYGLAMPGIFYRSADGLTGFEQGPGLFNKDMRHAALLLKENLLYVFWSEVGDNPEHIKVSEIDLSGDWQAWKEGTVMEVLRPELDWEGAEHRSMPSIRGAIEVPANQLRDPAIYTEKNRVWLFYSVAGESGIAGAEILVKGK